MSINDLLSRFNVLNKKESKHLDNLTDDFLKECFPISFCLEASTAIAENPNFYPAFEKSLYAFFQKIKENPDLRFATKINFITFNSVANEVRVFSTVDQEPNIPSIEITSGCNLIDGISTCLTTIEEILEYNAQVGTTTRKPWLIILSDATNQDLNEWDPLLNELDQMILSDSLFVVPIALTSRANTQLLHKISPTIPALMLNKNNILELFNWIEDHVHNSLLSRAHTSFPVGSPKDFDVINFENWGVLDSDSTINKPFKK